jgi:hypothetical protein
MNFELLIKIITPFLMKLGEKAVESGAEKIGEQSAEGILSKSQKIWNKIRPKLEAKESAKKAAEDMVRNTEDLNAYKLLRNEIHEIIEAPENINLKVEIDRILSKIEKENTFESKFNIKIKESSIGAVGDRSSVKMKIVNKT